MYVSLYNVCSDIKKKEITYMYVHVYDSHIHVDMNSSAVFAGLNAAVFSEEKISQSLGVAYAQQQSKSCPFEP